MFGKKNKIEKRKKNFIPKNDYEKAKQEYLDFYSNMAARLHTWKIISFLIYLIFMGILFTKYTSLHGIFLIPYSLLILIEYALFIKKDK